jgi:hypothetical protein
MNNNTNNHPNPKFSVNDIVSLRGRGGGYHIYDRPSWNIRYSEWVYPFDYGLGNTSEGSARESQMSYETK